MKYFKLFTFVTMAIGLMFVLGADLNIFAQGQSGNKSRARSTVNSGSQRPVNNQGSQTGNQSSQSVERRENRINRERESRRSSNIPNDKEIRRFGGIARKLGTTPESLRADYRAALEQNPDLNFGQFVSANVIADNLNATHPNVTVSAILNGLGDGKSLGGTLKSLGLSSSEVKEAKKEANRRMKENKRRDKANN